MKKSSIKVSRKIKEKPSWDNTVSDLNVYKLTPEEILQRKIDHISKNQQINFPNVQISSKKPESVYDRLSKIRYGNQIKDDEIHQRRKILKDMFTSDKELFDLFEQSEKTLSTVESMFGDPLKRYKVNPSVTPAPNFSFSNNEENKNNSNSCALNDISDSEIELSKSEIPSARHQSQDNSELSKFRNFIENERKAEEILENRRNKMVNGKNTMKMVDISTETELSCESNDVLTYICSKLFDSPCRENFLINFNKDLIDKIINHMVNLSKKNAIKIDSLNADLNHNKELIDALTLELINNNEHIKQMRNEFGQFTKKVTAEMSDMKSLIIKYLDQRIPLSDPKQINNNFSGSSTASIISRSKDMSNFSNEANCINTEELLIHEQLNSLQMEHNQTERRLKNLLRIQDSLSHVSGGMQQSITKQKN